VDRSPKRIAFIGSAAGGMDIEEVAAKSPRRS
jgi:succinyl-CoA synthetase beta subunit